VALDMSLATTKRRLARTWKRLAVLVRTDPALGELLPMFDEGIEGEA
jgi:hypothetical protein